MSGVPFHTTTAYGPIFAEQSQVVQANLLQVGVIEVDLVVNEPTDPLLDDLQWQHYRRDRTHALGGLDRAGRSAAQRLHPRQPAQSPIPNGELMGEDARLA